VKFYVSAFVGVIIKVRFMQLFAVGFLILYFRKYWKRSLKIVIKEIMMGYNNNNNNNNNNNRRVELMADERGFVRRYRGIFNSNTGENYTEKNEKNIF